MTLTWCGHSCFLLETDEGRVVFDPYAPGSVPGLTLPPLAADTILCSHGHHDHGWAEGVKQTYRLPGYRVETVDCWHDEAQGAKRGENRVHIVCTEGKRIVHLGDLGHVLTPEQAEKIGRPDVLMIPVGGYYTIDADQAEQVCRMLRPRQIVPMHFRGPGFGYEEIGPVSAFTARFEKVWTAEGSSVELTEAPDGVLLFSRPLQSV